MCFLKKIALATTSAFAIAAAAPVVAAPLATQDSAVYADAADLAKARRSSERASVNALLLAKGKSQTTADSLIEAGRFIDKNGVVHVRYEQRLKGLRVHGGYAKAAFDKNGDLLHMIERVAADGGFKSRPTITDADALASAIDANFKGAALPAISNRAGGVSTFAKTSFFHRAPTVERVVIADGVNSEGFLVETWGAGDNRLYHTLVDGVGRILSNELRTAEDSYNIFADHPDATPQAIVSGPGAGNAQSPIGWLGTGAQTTININGNNVSAYLDRDNTNTPDPGGVSVTNGAFLTAANLTQAPTTTQNQAVAIQNLFYLNNVIHDRLYSHGFVEATGNFQISNFGKGGLGNDPVNAEAQDGSGSNNANFATPSDGSRPRMQMYLWTTPNPDRDGDLDSDIVWHEYGHGLTWRSIGSMSGGVSGAIGEGMSDVLAIIVNNEDRVGEYSTLDPDGIRSVRYGLHQETIGDFLASRGVHRNGEIIAAAVWEMWKNYEAAGFTANDALDDIVSGMNFIPAAPTYFHMRDGFLAQAPANRDCLIWAAFAEKGMGEGGSMNSTGSSITESFTVPATCGGTPSAPSISVAATSANKAEGNSGAAAFTFTMTRSGDLSAASSAAFAVTGSGANPANAADFGGAFSSGTVNFAINATSQTVTVNVAGDTTVEPDEGFTVTLSNPTNATIATAAASGLIVNDDSGGPGGGFAIGATVATTERAAAHDPLGGPRLGVQPAGSIGVITEGPGSQGGTTWWRVDFASGVDGWVRQKSLAVQ
jgi:hypothetical protein